MHERLRECSEVQDPITAAARESLVGTAVDVLVDGEDEDGLVGRTYREAPEIDGIVRIMGAVGTARRDRCACASPARSDPIWRRARDRPRVGAARSARARSLTPANLVTCAPRRRGTRRCCSSATGARGG